MEGRKGVIFYFHVEGVSLRKRGSGAPARKGGGPGETRGFGNGERFSRLIVFKNPRYFLGGVGVAGNPRYFFLSSRRGVPWAEGGAGGGPGGGARLGL